MPDVPPAIEEITGVRLTMQMSQSVIPTQEDSPTFPPSFEFVFAVQAATLTMSAPTVVFLSVMPNLSILLGSSRCVIEISERTGVRIVVQLPGQSFPGNDICLTQPLSEHLCLNLLRRTLDI